MNDSNRQAVEVEPISLSRNELRALGAKAARGGGMDWGLAEEAGAAAAWLNARGIPGATTLARYLAGPLTSGEVILRQEGAGWRAHSTENICPVQLGAAILDYATVPDGPLSKGLTSTLVLYPLLIVPFVAAAAQLARVRAFVSIADLEVDVCNLRTDATLALAKKREGVVQVRSSPATTPAVYGRSRPTVSSQTVTDLLRMAAESMVPPSTASRQDAGATGSDND